MHVSMPMKKVNNKKVIPLMKPFMPPIEDFLPYLESIWESSVLSI